MNYANSIYYSQSSNGITFPGLSHVTVCEKDRDDEKMKVVTLEWPNYYQ